MPERSHGPPPSHQPSPWEGGGRFGGRGHNAATSSVKVFLYHILCRYDIYKLSRASTSTQNFSFRLFSLSFFLFFFLYCLYFSTNFHFQTPTATISEPLATATSGSLPHCHRPLVLPAGLTGWKGGREGGRELRASVLLPFYLFHLLLLVSFCELGATCCCGRVSRLNARFAKEKKKKNNTSMNPTICSPHRLRRFKQVEIQGGAVSYCAHLVTLFHIYLLKSLWISLTFSPEENENCQKKTAFFFFCLGTEKHGK